MTEESQRYEMGWKKLLVASKEFGAEEETYLNNFNNYVDLFNESPGLQNRNYDDTVDWLATNVNDLGFKILDD